MHGQWSAPTCFRCAVAAVLLSVALVAAADEELEAVKERILAQLGLSRVPDLARANVSREHMRRMLDLYQRSVLQSEHEEEEEDPPSLHSFYSHADAESSQLMFLRSDNSSTSQRLFFPLGKSPSLKRNRLIIKSAKLRLSGKPGGKEPKVVIYKSMKSSQNNGHIRILSQTINPNASFLSEVDLTDTVRSWVRNPNSNFGLLVECHGCAEYADSYRRSDWIVREPAVLDVLTMEPLHRARRSNSVGPSSSNTTFLDCTKGLRTKLCCRRSLKMSFKEIGWDWIVKPVEFESFFCKGRCDYKSNSFATTHAFVQSILHSKGRRIPKPCCAPRKLRSLNMLHFNDNDPPQLVVTRQKGMIVKDCACL